MSPWQNAPEETVMIRVAKELIGFTLVAMIVLLLAAGTKLWVNADSSSVSGNSTTSSSSSSSSSSNTTTAKNNQGNLKITQLPQTTLDGVYSTTRVTGVSVSTPIDQLRQTLLTPQQIAAGDKLSIYVCNNKNRKLEDYIKGYASLYPGETAATCIQVDLYRNDQHGNVIAIRESTNPIVITIGIPAHLRKENRSFRVIAARQTGGSIAYFSDTDLSDTSITIAANVYGTYVITYSDAALPVTGITSNIAAADPNVSTTNAIDPMDLYNNPDKTTFQGYRIADKYDWGGASDRLKSFYIVLDNNDIRTIWHQMYYTANKSDSYMKNASVLQAIQNGNAGLVSSYGYNAILDFYKDPATGAPTYRWYTGDGQWNNTSATTSSSSSSSGSSSSSSGSSLSSSSSGSSSSSSSGSSSSGSRPSSTTGSSSDDQPALDEVI